VSSSLPLFPFPLLCLPHDTSHGFYSAVQCAAQPCSSFYLSVCSPCMHGHWKENDDTHGGERERERKEEWIRRERSSAACKDHSVTGGNVASCFSPTHHLLPSLSLTNRHNCFCFMVVYLHSSDLA
uniref:Uncharacterized protein n=1 Tax=Oryza brachyantha TaxID=4533 RepID=J3M0G4_ORYBR